MKENNKVWKPVVGYEGLYEVSENGEVRNVKSKRILKQWISNKYAYVALCKNAIIKKMKIHRLVAISFISNENNKPQVNHIDANKLNNNLCNLEWCTQKENMQHAKQNNLLKQKKGISIKGKITVDLETGIFYDSLDQACKSTNYNLYNAYNYAKRNSKKIRFKYI